MSKPGAVTAIGPDASGNAAAASPGGVIPGGVIPEALITAGANADGSAAEVEPPTGFQVSLTNFTGPFDLLLTLISSKRLDVTEVSLHQVTDEFIAFTKTLIGADLDQTTSFLVVAATLLDLKAARLLPSGEVEDPEDLALLEARDLLFARLLQYRAFKQIAVLLGELEAAANRRYPRSASLEPRYASLLPEVELGVDPAGFAAIAVAAFAEKPIPQVGLSHLHSSRVSVPEQALRIGELLRGRGAGEWMTFAELVAECESGVHVVARFLALLELYRERAVWFDQPEALGRLRVTWSGDRDNPNEMVLRDDYDDDNPGPDGPENESRKVDGA